MSKVWPPHKGNQGAVHVKSVTIQCRVLSPSSLCLSLSHSRPMLPWLLLLLPLSHPPLISPSPLLPHSLSLAKAYSYGKQGTANYDDSDEDGATGYSYYSTSYGDEGSPAISSSNEEEESEPEELEESLENCSVNDSIS